MIAPASEAEIAGVVIQAREAGQVLRITGGNTREKLGRIPHHREGHNYKKLSLTRLTGITLYEPREMVLSAKAGTPLAEITQLLVQNNQILPFEPPDYRALFGTEGEPTAGALAACNLSGSRRISHGAARDSLIGLRFINGFGEAIKSGGRVMKNVTGLDLVKLQCGAFGTLGAISEATFKLLPGPERAATLVLHGLDDVSAVAAMSRALGSPFEVSGVAHLPKNIGADHARTLFRIENFDAAVTYRIDEIRKLLAPVCPSGEVLDEADTQTIWRAISDVRYFAAPDARTVWRISTAPARAPALVAAIARDIAPFAPCSHFYDWGGGLIWLAMEADAAGDGGAKKIRVILARYGGHATLVRAPDSFRAGDVFQPQPQPLMALTRRIKASFDPSGILNPGLMYEGV